MTTPTQTPVAESPTDHVQPSPIDLEHLYAALRRALRRGQTRRALWYAATIRRHFPEFLG